MPEESLGTYDLLERVAAGGQATVHRAWDGTAGRIVAIKVLHEHLTADSSYLERFRREARIAADLDHPNIARVFDVGGDRGRHYIAMEYLPESLARVLQTGRPMPVEQAVNLLTRVLEGLVEAHRHGIVHRDMKPQNILLTADGVPKIADFGIARAADMATMTRTGIVMGTPQYMAPEQVRGERVDQRTDLYAVGIMLYQMLAGSLPFGGDTPWQVVQKQLEQDAPELPATLRVPRALERIAVRALARDPSQRYQNAAGMAQALRETAPRAAPSFGGTAIEANSGGQAPRPDRKTESRSASPPPHGADPIGPSTALIRLEQEVVAARARIESDGNSDRGPRRFGPRTGTTPTKPGRVLLAVLVVGAIVGASGTALGYTEPAAVAVIVIFVALLSLSRLR